MGFKRQTTFTDFEEYLKDLGRKIFLRSLGQMESSVRIAQRKLRRERKK